jgi:hypothetical protein
MYWLAQWLLRHLDEAKLLLWIASRGGHLHPNFESVIARERDENPPSPPMQTLWRLVLARRVLDQSEHLELYSWRKRFARDGLTFVLRMQLREFLTPHVRLTKPFHWPEQTKSAEPTVPTRISDLVQWEIVLAASHVHTAMHGIMQDDRWCAALPGLLSDATQLLRDALDLMRELGRANDREDGSYVFRPSIAEHPQNQRHYDWTFLIDLVRDAWLATAETSPELARLEVERWLTIPYPLFRRFVFFAATQSQLFLSSLTVNWLLEDGHWWLWSVETERSNGPSTGTSATTDARGQQPLSRHHSGRSTERDVSRGPRARATTADH